MDDLISLIVFIVFAIIGILGKMRQKSSEDMPETQEPWRDALPRDLPEKTREILFGRGKVQQAKPAQSQEGPRAGGEYEQPVRPVRPAGVPPVATPRQVRADAEPVRPRTHPPARPQPRPAPGRPARPPQPPRAVPPAQGARPQPRPAARRTEDESGPRMRPQDMQQFSAERMRQQAMARLAGGAPKPPAPPGARAPQPPAAAQRQPEPAHGVTALIRNLDEVRRGVILSELLGPPLSMRGEAGP